MKRFLGMKVCGHLALLVLLASFVSMMAVTPMMAQSTTSTLTGTITDGSGAFVATADVLALNTATGVEYKAKADNQGNYRITQLPPGSYTLRVTSKGFKTQQLQAFTLLVDQQARQDVQLGVGETSESVTVSGGEPLLDTIGSNEGQVIENKQIQDLPLNGRNFLQLAQLSAGVTPADTPGMSSPASSWTGPQTVSISVAGLREDDTSYLFDGIEVRNAWYGAIGILPSIDNIQEFKIEQTGSSAAYGAGGTFVNIVTKSGTNQFHGSVFEFLRNNALDAKNYFDVGSAPAFHQNQFGASFGGPIKKNKMFFFTNYEGYRQIQPTTVYTRVPTAAQLSGDFSSDNFPLVNPVTQAPYTNNQIPTSQFSPAALKMLAYYPAPNGSFSGGNNFVVVERQTVNWDQGSARVDYTINDKNTIFGRYTMMDQTSVEPGITPDAARIFPSNPKNVAVGWTHIFNPNIVNNVRFGWNHTETGQNRADGYDTSKANPLGLNNIGLQPGSYGPPSINISGGYGNPGSAGGTEVVRENLFMGTESLSIQHKQHTITTGADIRYDPIYLYEDWQGSNLTFNGNFTKGPNVPSTQPGDALADALVGATSSAATSTGDPTLNLRRWYQSYYGQDTMQVNKRLTINGGVRYEYYQQPWDTANHVGSFDFATGTLLTYPDTKALGLGRQMVHPSYVDFSPRLGFNYSPFKNGATIVKGGFGIYFLSPNINQLEVMVDTPKYYSVQNYNNARNTTTGQLNFTLDQLFGLSLPGAGQSVSFINANNKTPVTYEYSLAVQRNFLKNWLLEVSYFGSQSRHYETRIVINPLNTNGQTGYANYAGAIQENLNAGTSNYNALAARVEKHYTSGFSLLGTYTYSKCLGTPWQDQFAWHPLNLRQDYGHCTYDQNQRLSVNSVYELPFGKGKMLLDRGGLMNAVVGGWQASAIATFYTGPWLTLGSSQNLGAFVNALPNVTGAVTNKSLHGGLGKSGKLGPYFNTQNVQAITAVGVQGNAGVSNVQEPGSATWDLSAFKSWQLAQRYGLTFRADFFNAFNRVNFTGLDTGVNDTNFGNLTGANAAREIQFSLRLNY
jgi:outer membrane receptor protein involved in Fe transport